MAGPRSYLPLSGMDLPRFAGIPTFMRLPHVPVEEAEEVQIGLIGVPWDGGTTNRPGPRHGPRQLRDCSTMIRMINQATGLRPFNTARCADLGDCPVNPADLQDSLQRISAYYGKVRAKGIVPMTAGGDHLVIAAGAARPGRQRRAGRDDPFRRPHRLLRHLFRRLPLHPRHAVPARRRGRSDRHQPCGADRHPRQRPTTARTWSGPRAHGVRIVMIEELMDRGPDAVMAEARAIVGDQLCYVSFDIDGIDPSQAPGTGTPEIGGFSTHTAQRMVRQLQGLNLIGADLVEVSPPFDQSGMTAWVGVNIMFELLCVLADAVSRRSANG